MTVCVYKKQTKIIQNINLGKDFGKFKMKYCKKKIHQSAYMSMFIYTLYSIMLLKIGNQHTYMQNRQCYEWLLEEQILPELYDNMLTIQC